MILLTGYQTPDGLRRMGVARLEKWLRDRHAYHAGDLAARAIAAANVQRVTVIGQQVAASVVARLAQTVLDLNAELGYVDAMIEAKFQQHRLAGVNTSMPGFGSLLGAELLAATNGDLASFNTADRLAGIAGLAPVPRESGRMSGNLKRPRRYDRRLLRVFYLAANSSIKTCPNHETITTASGLRAMTLPVDPVPGTTPSQRPLGHAARQHQLPTWIAMSRLTISLRPIVTFCARIVACSATALM
jgi:Transposase IS116/IS110/IS902 family